jgi:hypothetical protein
MHRSIEQPPSDESYYTIAESVLTNGEPEKCPVTQFVASVFELSDDFPSLEAAAVNPDLDPEGFAEAKVDAFADLLESLRSIGRDE